MYNVETPWLVLSMNFKSATSLSSVNLIDYSVLHYLFISPLSIVSYYKNKNKIQKS